MLRSTWLQTVRRALNGQQGKRMASTGRRGHSAPWAADIALLETRTLLAASMPELSVPEEVTGPAVGDLTAESKTETPFAPNTASFQAIGLQDQFNDFGTGSLPPDTMGAVGPNHFVEMINSSVAIYAKAGSRLSHVSLTSFFTDAGEGITPANGTFDPRILYDQSTGRWFATAMERGVTSGKDNDIILAISDTSDPTGDWDRYRIDVGIPTGTDAFFTDYSTLGVDENGVYFGMRMFQDTGNDGTTNTSFAKIAMTPKASLLTGTLGTVTQVSNITDMFSSPQPATNFDDISESTPFFFVSSSTTVFGNVNYRTVTWSGGVPTLSSTSAAATPAYGNPINAPASGSTTNINVGDDRLQMAVVRNGHLWTTRQVGLNSSGTSSSPDRTGVEWIDLSVSSSTLTLSQSGRIFDSAASTPRFYYYPSLAVNGQGHMRIGFSGSNANEFVGAYSSGRLSTDAAGTTTAPVLIKAGEASYTRNDGSGRNRWGDYSFTSVDPTDDMTVWTIQEYAESNGTNVWGTWISTIAAPTPTLNNPADSAAAGASGVTLNLTGTNFFDPGAGYPNHLDVQLTGGTVNGITVQSVSFVSPTSATVTLNVAANATPGTRDIVLTNPDGQTVTVVGGFTVTSSNTVPSIGGAVSNQAVNDNATISPFSALTVTDPDTQAMSAIVRIQDGNVRGDFTGASSAGWTRTVVGNHIDYSRTFASGANIGATVQAAIRALVFDPRENAITPGATETTTFTVTVTDGVASPVSNSATSVITTSVNNSPAIAVANTPFSISDNISSIDVFAAAHMNLTVTDADTQSMSAIVRINNGTVRGDFTSGTGGWTRTVSGNDIQYARTFAAGANIGATVQSAIWALSFTPRENVIKPGTTEATNFTVIVADGVAAPVTNSLATLNVQSANDNETLGGAANVAVNDNATINPLSNLTVTDPDFQEGSVKVTILNGVFRGDFTSASTTGWTRTTLGNDISYFKYFNPGANVGATLESAARALVFQPRQNAIAPGTIELTDFQVVVSDGIGTPVSNVGNLTRLSTTSVNNAPSIGGAVASQTMLDFDTILPFSSLTVTDPDTQAANARVTIINGVARGDFTNGIGAGWTRTFNGNDIVYTRVFTPGANIGGTVQTAIQALRYQPRQNVLTPGLSETTAFSVFVNDGLANTTNSTTSVVSTSSNDAPGIAGAVANQPVNDNATIQPFSTLIVQDLDNDDMLARVTIPNGVNRGDFTPASTVGWTRTVVGIDYRYERYFSPASNIGATVQAAIRALVFQPRNNVPIGTTETTGFTVFVNDGTATATNSSTTVVTTGVAPRLAASAAILDSDVATVIVPSVKKTTVNGLARLLKKIK